MSFMSDKYKTLCFIAGLIVVAAIACMVFLDGVRGQPNPVGLLLLVVGIVFWMFILARGFGLYDDDDDDDGDSGGGVDILSETEILPSKRPSPPPPEPPPLPPPE
mgnify:CR=1 FL=1